MCALLPLAKRQPHVKKTLTKDTVVFGSLRHPKSHQLDNSTSPTRAVHKQVTSEKSFCHRSVVLVSTRAHATQISATVHVINLITKARTGEDAAAALPAGSRHAWPEKRSAARARGRCGRTRATQAPGAPAAPVSVSKGARCAGAVKAQRSNGGTSRPRQRRPRRRDPRLPGGG